MINPTKKSNNEYNKGLFWLFMGYDNSPPLKT